MKFVILFLLVISFLSACNDSTQSKNIGLSLTGDDYNGSGSNDEEEVEVIDDEGKEEIIINGDQVCYENESCHKIVHQSEMTTPGAYVYNTPGSSLGQQYRKPTYFVDLEEAGTSEYVSHNFKRSEYMALHKGRYGLLAPHFVYRVQKIRDSLGKPLKVNSGYRGPDYNASIGGAKWSRHMYGDALDFKVSGKTPSQLKAYCQAQGASYIQVYSTHVHCDWRNVSLAEEFYPTGMIPILTKVQTTELNHHAHMEFYDHIDIEMDDRGDSAIFSVQVADAEDGVENLLIEWEVYRNNKKLKESQSATTKVNFSEPGDYLVQVTVGGYWKKYKIISR